MMKNRKAISMKKVMILNVLFLMGLMFSCEGPEGPQGAPGPQGSTGGNGAVGAVGPQGVQGAIGNANVKLYSFEGHDFRSVRAVFYFIDNTSKEQFDRTLYLIYMGQFNEQRVIWYHMPGYGELTQTIYQSHMRYFTNNPNISRATATIFRNEDAGPGEVYDETRIFAIVAEPGNRIDLSNIDLSNYEEVATKFGFMD